MKAKLLIATVSILAIGLVATGAASGAFVAIYRNALETTAQRSEILKLRDEGQVLHTYKELRELLRQRLPKEPRFTDETLQTVIGLLDGPGAVKGFSPQTLAAAPTP